MDFPEACDHRVGGIPFVSRVGKEAILHAEVGIEQTFEALSNQEAALRFGALAVSLGTTLLDVVDLGGELFFKTHGVYPLLPWLTPALANHSPRPRIHRR
jgi:hypothetical protein